MFKSTQKKNNSKAIVVTMAFLLVSLIFSAPIVANENSESRAEDGKAAPAIKVYFSVADEFEAPLTEAQTVFDCSDKIYTVLELRDYELGRHDFTVQWIDPAGQTRETTQYPFSVRGSDTRLWAWLSLSRATGAGMLQWIDPAAGLEEFIGEWNVEVRINGQLISREKFAVNC